MPVILWLCRLARVCFCILQRFLRRLFWQRPLPHYGRRKAKQTTEEVKPVYYRIAPKPEWVKKEILRLKALMPKTGCRTIKNIFNRRFKVRKNITVGKTYAPCVRIVVAFIL